ncbi:MAG: Cys-Gln thioester bond-forming surface protein [Clostridia bacterium]|nr:Cys-Gln thioester bond-forming surface protein [Clostridia bacterium]
MKLKRGILFIIILFLTMLVISSFGTVKAATGSLYLNIKMLRNSGYGYQLANGQKNVWKIYEVGGNVDDTIYCLKGGPGFGSGDFATGSPQETHYTQYFDLKNPSSITPSIYLNALPTVNSLNYTALIWILDNCYVAPKAGASTEKRQEAAENKRILLEAAAAYAKAEGNPDISSSGREFSYLTDDDIDATQQLAVWYYTNPTGPYHVTTFEFWLNRVAGTDGNYQPLDEVDGGAIFTRGEERAAACQALFDYLVETPQKPGFTYDYASSGLTQAPVQLADTNITAVPQGDRIIIGPYRIEELRNIKYSLEKTILDGNGNTISNAILLDRNQNEVASSTTLKDLIGQNFYISVPTGTNTSRVEFKISGSFFTTTTTYWSVANPGATDQPVVKIEKTPNTYEDEKTYTEAPVEIFDLALRKFITSIQGAAPEKTREPQIESTEITKLINGTTQTATKVHPKNPLVVKKGDKVIYTIRVYNEGNVGGYATQVTDYLPEGLIFLPESNINKTYGWTNPSGDGKTIVTDYLKDALINPVTTTSTQLDYKDLQIECEVASTATNSTLKNITEITAHKDEHGNTAVVDRDSEPNSLTENQKNNYGETQKQDDDDFENLILFENGFDLTLRKFIISIAGNAPEEDRTPKIPTAELTKLKNGTTTTVNKEHPKNALTVKTGDKVVYKIRVYNEGNVAGYAAEITDHLPAGLTFLPESDINKAYGWSNPSGDGKTIVTTYLADKLLDAFDGTDLDYEDIQIECEVTAAVTDKDQSLKNIAEITKNRDEDGNPVEDRDSTPNNVDKNNYGETNQEDDDDFENLILKGQYFDLSLRKFITGVNDRQITNREPQVILEELKDGSKTTATYEHPKTPIGVSNGDIVTYTIRVYNEGQIDGYVTEITDHLPEQLEFLVEDSLNAKYGWTVETDGRTVKTTITSPNTNHSASRDEIYNNRRAETDKVLLEAFDGNNLNYIDVQIKCKVKEDINLYQKITNIAQITAFTDSEGNPINDRDSAEKNVVLPNDQELPSYKDVEIDRGDKYIPGQQDDDDFEKLVLQRFDLSLRKFITGVNDKEITNRAPVFTKVNDTEYKYEHTKEPVLVANGNTVIYTLRIFNEGNVAGYAKEIKDNLPEGLVFLPEHELNQEYRWKMIKEDGTQTDNLEEAVSIRTDYLSKEQEKQEGANLIKEYNPATMTMPDYKDVKIAFKVTEPNTSDRIIINTAEITDDSDEKGKPIDDIDSTPDNDKEGEDDIDIEKIKVQYFDLSLKKWVTESIVTYGGKTTVTKTGHTGDENPEPPAKVEIRGSRIDKTTVKFKFNIKVTNEGEIAGYAKELIDYIPEGLKFEQKDNPKWKVVDGKVVTDQLKDTLLQPGESATVEIILTWINNKDNLGEKVNWAEISKDDNEYDAPDIDSTPGNNVKGEDDIDRAPVILSVVTGSVPTYITLAMASISMIAGGVILIKKFVI